jgi:hypothetical protein
VLWILMGFWVEWSGTSRNCMTIIIHLDLSTDIGTTSKANIPTGKSKPPTPQSCISYWYFFLHFLTRIFSTHFIHWATYYPRIPIIIYRQHLMTLTRSRIKWRKTWKTNKTIQFSNFCIILSFLSTKSLQRISISMIISVGYLLA